MKHKILRISDNKHVPILEHKVAIINGVSSEIGSVTAEVLLKNGAYICGTYNKHKTKVNRLVVRYGKERVIPFQIDFLDDNYEKEIEKIVNEIKVRYGRIDILINVAGVWLVKPFLYEEKDESEKVWRINFWAAYKFIKKVLPYMMKAGGSIINIASTAGIKGTGQAVSYSASKAALISLTESLAEEFAPRNIRVNTISPGFTNTSAINKYFDKPIKELLIKRIPIARLCKPIDVANAVLAILMNDYMEGINISLHGGRL